MSYNEQQQRLHEYAKGELERITKTVDEMIAHAPNSYSREPAYVGSLVQALVALELSLKK